MRAQPHRVAAQAESTRIRRPCGRSRHVPEKLAGVEVAAEAIEVGAVLAQRRDARIDRGSDVREVGRLQRCYERREDVVDAFFDLADTIITVRSLIRRAWTIYRWDSRPARRP